MFTRLMLLVAFIGCSDHTLVHKVYVDDTAVEELVPDIVVTPSYIDFGHLQAGHDIGEQTITIINAGQADLELSGQGFYGQPGFLSSAPGKTTLAPGEATSIELSYDPTTYEQKNSTFYITSNDPDEAVVDIPITGYGDAPVINVDPTYNHMGPEDIGCETETEINIQNLGNLDLEISSLQLYATLPPDFSQDSSTSIPLIIAPGSNENILLYYIPTDLGLDSSQLEIASNDPVNPLVIAETDAEGAYHDTITDLFEQAAIVKVDILFVVDNSGSMGQFQAELASNMNDFMNVFSTLGADYHIAVITTDSALFRGAGIITSANADPIGDLSSTISGIGIHGSGIERGLQYAHQSLSTGPAAPGGAFLRSDAALVIVYVSDERDYSAYTNPTAWQTYANYYDSIKSPGMVIAHSVVGDYPSGCQYQTPYGYTRTIQFGDGYYDQVQYYGGNNYSICAPDWGQQMQQMAQHSVPILRYILSEEGVIEDTISVTVNGTINSDWSYNGTENAVEFDAQLAPQEGDSIEIIYSILGCQPEDTGSSGG